MSSRSSSNSKKRAAPAEPAKARFSRVGFIIGSVGVVLLLLVSCFSFMLGRMDAGHTKPDVAGPNVAAPTDRSQPSGDLPLQGGRMLKPGPWGEIHATPISIAPPDELLNVSQIETSAIHWFFRGFSRDSLANLLDSLDLPGDQRDRLLDPSCLHLGKSGIDLTPPSDVVLSLPSKARQTLYELLVGMSENWQTLGAFDASLMEKNFREDGVSSEHTELFNKLSCPRGECLLFSGAPSLLSQVQRHEDKQRMLRAILRRDSLLLRLHVTPDTDVKALAEYWGRGATAADVKAILSSLQRIPGGTWANITLVLPARPAGLLYTFAHPQNPANGPPLTMDCHWTSFNFFKEPFERGYSNDQIAVVPPPDYVRIEGKPRYGDVALFMDSSNTVFHSAIFVADDVIYTKDGATPLRPWVLTTVSEVMREYAGYATPGQAVKIVYFRSRNH